MTEQERLDALISGFRKLDEAQKDHIRDLTRTLTEINERNGPVREPVFAGTRDRCLRGNG